MKILDCTLRDGGYVNNWQFSDIFVEEYFRVVNACHIDYVEIGFMNKRAEYASRSVSKYRCLTNSDIVKILPKNRKFKVAVMVDFTSANI